MKQDIEPHGPPSRRMARTRRGSPKEDQMIRAYLAVHRPCGRVVWEYQAVDPDPIGGIQGRWPDAVILMEEQGEEISLRGGDPIPEVDGKRVTVLQAKWKPITLGMSVLGQAFFSILLMEELGATVEQSVAICRRNDALLSRLASEVDSRLAVWATGDGLLPAEPLAASL